MRRIGLITICLLSALNSFTYAQPHSLTWRGAPIERTKSFLITECAVSYRFFHSPDFADGNNGAVHVSWELGWMRNTASRWAFGAAGYFGADDNASLIAFKPRARRWLSPETSLDISVGPIFQTLGDYRIKAPGLAASVSVMKGDLLGLTLTYELTPYRYMIFSPSDDPYEASGTRHALDAGMRSGSYAGTAVGIAIPVGVVIWILSVVGD